MKIPFGKYSHYIGIDPSSNDKKCGYCRIRASGSVIEEVFAGKVDSMTFPSTALVAVEKPEYRKYGRAAPGDILTLTLAAGALVERAKRSGATVVLPTPSEWTSLPKHVRQERQRELIHSAPGGLNHLRLDQLERTTPKTYLADAMDALCLAFWLQQQHAAIENIRNIVDAKRKAVGK